MDFKKDESTYLWKCSFCKCSEFKNEVKVWTHIDIGGCPGLAVGLRTQLDNGCQGFIPLKELSDHNEQVKIGMIIHARISKVEPKHLLVELTMKTDDLLDVDNNWKTPKDDFFDYVAEEISQNKLNEEKEGHKQTYFDSVVSHPNFKNVDYQQAVSYLIKVGDAVIRPNAKSNKFKNQFLFKKKLN